MPSVFLKWVDRHALMQPHVDFMFRSGGGKVLHADVLDGMTPSLHNYDTQYF